jgi:hypothetical protein
VKKDASLKKKNKKTQEPKRSVLEVTGVLFFSPK